MAIFNSQKPTAATKTQELGSVLKELDAARTEHEALLVTATTDGDDSRLANLRSRIERLAVKEGRIRNEIADAVAAERLVEQDKAYDAATAIGEREAQAADELVKTIAAIWPAVQKVLALDDQFRAAVPLKPQDWDQLKFGSALMGLIGMELYIASGGVLRPARVIESVWQIAQNPGLNTISGVLKEHIAMALKGRASASPERSAPGADEAVIGE